MTEREAGASITAGYRLTATDYARVAAANARRSTVAMIAGGAIAVLGVVALPSAGPAALLIVAMGLVLMSGILVVPFAVGAVRRQAGTLLVEVRLAADRDGLDIGTSDPVPHVPWGAIAEVKETGAALVFRLHDGGTFIIPRRALGTAGQASFRDLLREVGLLPPDRIPWLRLVTIAAGIALVVAAIVAPRAVG